MFSKLKRSLLLVLAGMMMVSCIACGNSQVGNTENSQGSEMVSESESETEKVVEIASANDILIKVWETYEEKDTDGNMYNDRFAIMGGHFESAVMDMPAQYDLTKTSDLELIYCVPQTVIPMLDDAATMVHLMAASTFTAGAYHVADAANVRTAVDAIRQQIQGNHWLDGFPDAYFVATVDEQYVIAVVGNAEVVDNFKATLQKIYGKQFVMQVEESIR